MKESDKMELEIAYLEKRLFDIETAYQELIGATGKKVAHESRHQTALRYIKERAKIEDKKTIYQEKPAKHKTWNEIMAEEGN